MPFKQRFTFGLPPCGEWIIMRQACVREDCKLACLFLRDRLKGSFCCCYFVLCDVYNPPAVYRELGPKLGIFLSLSD